MATKTTQTISGILTDRYLPDGYVTGDHRPALILVHGGGWTGGDKATEDKKARFWCDAAGFIVYAPNYTLATGGPYADPLQPALDLKAVYGWIATHPAHTSQQIHIQGFSAGGHVALAAITCLGEGNITPESVAAFYAPSDLTQVPGYENVWGPMGSPARAAMSPKLKLGYVPYPQTILYHGQADAAITWQQSIDLDAAWPTGLGNVCQLETRANGFQGLQWAHSFCQNNDQWAGLPMGDAKAQFRKTIKHIWGQWYRDRFGLVTGEAPVTP